ncbi:MAG: AraC family transcriptional regulator [Novosphingobium sp. 28-62-57]|uniref:helix-turn-helix domain-containing protein n=1 Tax=unclassified Novosphingobium TaxID=2644732 RepID=UPI000BD2FEF5|nr:MULTISPECIES: helix-turn-helix domain-containing protein [unclassified Novosphingobium]OYW51077.1 MAG: AraC family transcriptional regulator [Novosphingobium sp. 12-62-10]OYZ11102.1 MAG: AraC family transcriptional regulator [Novosphingobium sp. 28-62-57]OZA35889.1 MAG: AraC family transcriptional regulator [Novosphingobium sp. 17-62-9]HQS69473.1 helix-turn-helix domain-containing protein [Novosphingobium sp.]
MTRSSRWNADRLPGVDRAIASPNATRDGQPISFSRAPSADLERWIGRFYVTIVDTPPDHHLECGLLSDFACIRIQLRGRWQANTADGIKTADNAAMLFGPQSHRMPVSVAGSFTSVGAFLRPGVCHALNGPKLADLVDRLEHFADIGLPGQRWLTMFDPQGSPEDWVQSMEYEMRCLIAERAVREPDPISARFEAAAFSDPTISVAKLAEDFGVEQRRLERIVRRDFGMAPKQVLRRARALDMASHLRGVADHAEAEAIALRYYDQSHLIREFTELFGMSPRQFVERPQPLMTLGLETRQARRLETIRRLEPGEVKPWE